MQISAFFTQVHMKIAYINKMKYYLDVKKNENPVSNKQEKKKNKQQQKTKSSNL
jgi:hypothetical protein